MLLLRLSGFEFVEQLLKIALTFVPKPTSRLVDPFDDGILHGHSSFMSSSSSSGVTMTGGWFSQRFVNLKQSSHDFTVRNLSAIPGQQIVHTEPNREEM
jgi:hypothetical protein